MSVAPSTSLGGVASYACNPGYNLVGASSRTCQGNGQWSGSEPFCIGKLGTDKPYCLLMSHDDGFPIQHRPQSCLVLGLSCLSRPPFLYMITCSLFS